MFLCRYMNTPTLITFCRCHLYLKWGWTMILGNTLNHKTIPGKEPPSVLMAADISSQTGLRNCLSLPMAFIKEDLICSNEKGRGKFDSLERIEGKMPYEKWEMVPHGPSICCSKYVRSESRSSDQLIWKFYNGWSFFSLGACVTLWNKQIIKDKILQKNSTNIKEACITPCFTHPVADFQLPFMMFLGIPWSLFQGDGCRPCL